MQTTESNRRVNWMWRNEQHGYGILIISVLTPKGWKSQEYFAQPVRGPRGRVWTLAKLVEGVGIEREYTVNLIAASCDCDGFFHGNDCKHWRSLQQLDHHGRL